MKRRTSSTVRYPKGRFILDIEAWADLRPETIPSAAPFAPPFLKPSRISRAFIERTSVPLAGSCRKATSFLAVSFCTSFLPRYSSIDAGGNSMTLALSRTVGENMYVVSSMLTVPMTARLPGILTDLPPSSLISSSLSMAERTSEKYLSTWDRFISSRMSRYGSLDLFAFLIKLSAGVERYSPVRAFM